MSLICISICMSLIRIPICMNFIRMSVFHTMMDTLDNIMRSVEQIMTNSWHEWYAAEHFSTVKIIPHFHIRVDNKCAQRQRLMRNKTQTQAAHTKSTTHCFTDTLVRYACALEASKANNSSIKSLMIPLDITTTTVKERGKYMAHQWAKAWLPNLQQKLAQTIENTCSNTHERCANAHWVTVSVMDNAPGVIHVTITQMHEAVAEEKMTPAATPSYTVMPIATFQSVYREKYGTPRQGSVVPQSRGRITLRLDISEEAFDGIEHFSHVWLHAIFHQNENKAFHAKIEPPRLKGRRIGVYATRTPHRINPIAMTLAKLEKREGRTIWVSGVDLVDKTPIIDIKCMHPSEIIQELRVPEWLRQIDRGQLLAVEFTEEAHKQIVEHIHRCSFYNTPEEALEAIQQSLSADPRPYWIRDDEERDLRPLLLDNLKINYSIDNDKVLVFAIDFIA